MMKIIVLLCLGLIGCATVPGNNKVVRQPIKKTETTAIIPVDLKEVDSVIAIFSEAIKNNPNYAGAYYNRAVAYFYKKDYDKSWQDLHQAEMLGIKIDTVFIGFVNKLKKASGRQM